MNRLLVSWWQWWQSKLTLQNPHHLCMLQFRLTYHRPSPSEFKTPAHKHHHHHLHLSTRQMTLCHSQFYLFAHHLMIYQSLLNETKPLWFPPTLFQAIPCLCFLLLSPGHPFFSNPKFLLLTTAIMLFILIRQSSCFFTSIEKGTLHFLKSYSAFILHLSAWLGPGSSPIGPQLSPQGIRLDSSMTPMRTSFLYERGRDGPSLGPPHSD